MRYFDMTRNLLKWLPLLALLLVQPAQANLVELDEQALSQTAGQGLLWTDKITGSELTGSNAYSTPFTFYRMGVDGQIALNANISKLQLGCGGVNDMLNAVAGCDIDIDYVSFMGRNGFNVGNPLSAFTMERPYIELAIKNDGTPDREIVGIKIGAQSVDGALNAGRRYTSNAANQENTLAWDQVAMNAGSWNQEPTRTNGVACDTGVDLGNGAVGCHSGINSVSGFLGVELSLSMYVQTRVCVFICIGVNEWACVGRTAMGSDVCNNDKASALFLDLGGTRMQMLAARNARLFMTPNALVDLLGGEAFASLNTDLRMIHAMTFQNSADFSISFQREPVAYPNYSKMSPKQYFASLNPNFEQNGVVNYQPGDEMFMDGCATTRWDTARCTSAYSVPANTGWWINAPSVKLLNIVNNSVNLGDVNLAQALDLLGAPGLVLSSPDFNMTPAKNCYGATRFC